MDTENTSSEYIQPESNGYTIYSKSGCPNCVKVKNYLFEKKAKYTVVDCDDYIIDDKPKFLQFIAGLAEKEVKMFPMVFFNGQFIGGYTETESHYTKMDAFVDKCDF